MNKLIGFLVIAMFLASCQSKKSDTQTNTASQAVQYTCENGINVTTTVSQLNDSYTVELQLPDNKVAILNEVRTASGEKYANDQYEWWSKGDVAYFTDLKNNSTPLECKKTS